MDNLFEGIVSLSEDDKVLLQERIEADKKSWMAAAQNDETFVNDMRQAAEGKVYSSLERIIKKASGLKFDDLANDLRGADKFREMINQALKAVKANGDATNEELQQALLTAKEESRLLREEEIPQIQAKYQQKFDQNQIERALAEKLISLPLVPERTNPAKLYAKAVLNDRYKLDWDTDADTISIKTKQDLQPVINDKTASLDEVLNFILDEGGFLVKSNGTVGRPAPAQPKPATSDGTEWSANALKFAKENNIAL